MVLEPNNEMEDMIIKFDGPTNQISANTLINSLIHFTNMVEQVNFHIDETKKVEVRINALPAGSFLVDLQVCVEQVMNSNLLTKESVGYASDLVKTITGVYKIAKFLKGKRPKKVEAKDGQIIIENNNGTVNNFDLRGATIYLENKTIREIVSQSFETLESDAGVTGFQILDEKKHTLLEIPKDEFGDIANREESEVVTAVNEQIKSIENAKITMFSFDWGLKKRWQFYFDGNLISIKLSDEFKAVINSGEAFAKGDCIIADIDILQVFDSEANAYVNKSYTLTKYHRHIKRDEQSEINFPPK